MASNKEYCYKFINYLIEEGKIVDNKIEKELARTIYTDSFKRTNHKTGFPFSTMCATMERLHLVQYNKDYLIFNSDVLKRSNSNQNANDSAKHNSEKPLNTFIRCTLCQIILPDETSYQNHQKTDMHLLISRYVNNTKTLINPILGLRIEVENNSIGSDDVILLRKNEPKDIMLKVLNESGTDYNLIEIIEMVPKSDIIVRKQNVPILKNGSHLDFGIHVCFNIVVYVRFPLIFRLKELKSGKVTDVLKELTFHVHSSILDELHANVPFAKIKTPQIVMPMRGIVRGEHMKRSEGDFKPAIILQQYDLSDDLVKIFNNNMNDFDGLTKHQSFMLRDMKTLLNDFKFKYSEKLCERNYFEMLRLLLCLEEFQMKIDVKKYGLDDGTLLKVTGFHRNCLQLKVPGLAEHKPSLLRGDSVFVSENKNGVKYEGIVHQVQQDSVILGFSHKFIQKVHLENKKYLMSFGFNRVPIRAEHQAINLFNEHRAISILCKENFQIKELKNHQLVWFNKNIENNLQQQQAVRHILSQTARPMPYLVFGPPGTGKTVTIVESVLQVWKLFPSKRMLICAPSNNAADEIARRLVEIVPKRDLIRYVAPSYPYNLINDKVKPFVNYNNNEYFHPANGTLLTYRMVVCTLVNASRLVNGGTPKGHFEYVFIDESGQATESETLIPIAGILTSDETKGAITGQIVLAGDPKQLGPIIHSRQATLFGFDKSMLERLMNDNNIYKKYKEKYNAAAVTKLVQSYRSHPAILKVPNTLFYDGELVSVADKGMSHIAIGWEHLPNPDFPIIFHSVIGNDEREQNSPSFFNVEEIDVVLSYLSLLIGNKLHGMKITEEHIGIIAPYSKHVQKLRQACNKMNYGDKLFIGSVEQFQGQERLIIILTTVRSRPEFTSYDAKFHLGFLRNPKRFNVGITRAKALLIVIGNPKILLLDPNWHAFIKYCKDNSSTHGAPFTLEPLVLADDLTTSLASLKTDDPIIQEGTEDAPNFARGRV